MRFGDPMSRIKNNRNYPNQDAGDEDKRSKRHVADKKGKNESDQQIEMFFNSKRPMMSPNVSNVVLQKEDSESQTAACPFQFRF